MPTRREFVRQLASAAVPAVVIAQGPQGRPPAGAADTLAFPLSNTKAAIGPLDNDPGVIAIERRLRCNCGCLLDVYTCRTTDFSCTFSPAMHREVVSQVQRGTGAEQIVQWFVSQPEYGEKVLMAPPARGFNAMGYLVPGLTVAGVGLALVAWLARKRTEAGGPTLAATSPVPGSPSGDQLARLQRALDDVES